MVEELKSRFQHYVSTGDDSRIPADLQGVIFATVGQSFLIKCHGLKEWFRLLGMVVVKSMMLLPRSMTTRRHLRRKLRP